MQTRSSTLKSSKTSLISTYDEHKNKTRRNRKPNGFITFINELNFLIIKNLKFSKNPIKKLKININKSIRTYLIKKYDLNYSFKNCNNFIEENDIMKERYFQNIKTSFNKTFIKNDSFQLKLNKQMSVKFFDNKLQVNKIKNGFSLSVKFTRENFAEITNIQRSILDERRKLFFKK
jgi:hypothetical protein